MKRTLLFALVLLLQSCGAVTGLTDDYSKLSDAEKARIVPADFGKENTELVYKVSAAQLLAEAQKYDKVLIYEFTNGCSSDRCKPMAVYERYAKQHGYKLFLVMNGFGSIQETMAQRNAFESPLYAIDAKAYDKKFRWRYTVAFMKELTGAAYDKDNYGNLFFFENGKFVKQLSELPS